MSTLPAGHLEPGWALFCLWGNGKMRPEIGGRTTLAGTAPLSSTGEGGTDSDPPPPSPSTKESTSPALPSRRARPEASAGCEAEKGSGLCQRSPLAGQDQVPTSGAKQGKGGGVPAVRSPPSGTALREDPQGAQAREKGKKSVKGRQGREHRSIFSFCSFDLLIRPLSGGRLSPSPRRRKEPARRAFRRGPGGL